jgi:hypothetical protein
MVRGCDLGGSNDVVYASDAAGKIHAPEGTHGEDASPHKAL